MDDYYEDGREIFDEDPDDKNGKKGGAAAKKAAKAKKVGKSGVLVEKFAV